MNTSQLWLRGAAILVMATILAGCPSSSTRTTVEGYDDAKLNGKRVLLLLPEPGDIRLTDSTAYAFARGTVGEGAREQLAVDLRTRFVPAIDLRLDSNTVLTYREQPVSGTVPLNPTTDFSGGQPKSWETLRRAGREGNIDYLIVLSNMQVKSTASSSGGRGDEGIEADYMLIDPLGGKVVTSGRVSTTVRDLPDPGAAYTKLAGELASKLPFHVADAVR